MLLEVFYLCGINGLWKRWGKQWGIFKFSCKFKNIGEQFKQAFIDVYGPNLNKRHRKCGTN